IEAERRVGSRLALVAVPALVGATSSGQQACQSGIAMGRAVFRERECQEIGAYDKGTEGLAELRRPPRRGIRVRAARALLGFDFSGGEGGARAVAAAPFRGPRSLIGGLSMLAVALVWGGRPGLRGNFVPYASLSMLNVVLFIGLQSFAITLLPSGTAAVLIYLQPILTGLLAWLVLGESLSWIKFAGLLLGFSGIVVVSAGGISGEIAPKAWPSRSTRPWRGRSGPCTSRGCRSGSRCSGRSRSRSFPEGYYYPRWGSLPSLRRTSPSLGA